MKHKYEIGQTLVNEHRNLTITDRKIQKGKTKIYKQYKYKCNKCGFDCTDFYREGKFIDEYWIEEAHLANGTGCTCCYGRAAKDGINSLITTHKNSCNFIVNEQDKHRYTYGSSKKIQVYCPVCKKERLYRIKFFISDLKNNNFHCQNCSDKMPMGEKIMYTLLTHLNVDFTKEMVFDWSNGKRYDFYIKSSHVIIEVMGKQHIEGTFSHLSGKTLEQEKLNDKLKYDLAIKNGFKKNNYIYINSFYSNFDYIIENIKKSALSQLYDLQSINWNVIKKESSKSLLTEISNYWTINQNCNTLDIANVFHISRPTATHYLKLGHQAGFCIYDKTEVSKRRVNIYKNDTVNTATPIICNETNQLFKSYGLCCRLSKDVFGIQLNEPSIKSVLDGKYKQHKGFTFSYISKATYNQALEHGDQCYGSPFNLFYEED